VARFLLFIADINGNKEEKLMINFKKYLFPIIMVIVWLIVLFSNPGIVGKIVLTLLLIVGAIITGLINKNYNK
jgi:hypothetical protein